MFQTLNTSPLNTGDIDYNAARSYMPSMVSTSEVDDLLIVWGSSVHSMSCSGTLFQNLESTAESSHKSMICSGVSDAGQWAGYSGSMAMVSNGEADIGQFASAESSHRSMVCESWADVIPQAYSECTMTMHCSGEFYYTVGEFEVLRFSRS